MKIALCQLQIQYECKEENLKTAEGYIKEASDQKVDLILFPEMSFTGFSMNTLKTGEEQMETVNVMKQLAEKYQVAIGFGWVKHQKNCENHYTVVDASGKTLGDYIKIHPFSFAGEDEVFTKGQAISFFQYQGMTFGITICYDLRFPELYQRLSEEADAIIVAANWPKVRVAQWDALLQARAIENQSYILGVNCTGTQEDTVYSGHGKVIAPDGTVVLDLKEDAGMHIMDLDNDVQVYREKFPMKQDRRKAFYKNFY
ncbi:MAG: carbon-nitrogen family hydrolase [Eubacterium sp.]|nr:carbon-nitrogen family hydrolase [Eubacterium sp.]